MKKIYLILMGMIFILTSCNKLQTNNLDMDTDKDNIKSEEVIVENDIVEEINLLNENGMTIEERYKTPKEFQRVEVEDNSFEKFLRNQELKSYGSKVLYYDGREKNNNVYDSVINRDIGDRDLHQCADAIMLLRGEYLFEEEKYDEISFNFVQGFKAEYSKWMDGNRIKVDGNNVRYIKNSEPSNTYENFRKYMDMVFAYSGTLSLDKELQSVDINSMKIGDIFIVGGSPGHGVIVVDMAENENGEKIFILAQSYMPAQETQILINKNDESISPWYRIKDTKKLYTPEWTFEWSDIKKFSE